MGARDLDKTSRFEGMTPANPPVDPAVECKHARDNG